MKHVFGLFCAIALLCVSNTSYAVIVIDDFTTSSVADLDTNTAAPTSATTTLANGIKRTLTLTGAPGPGAGDFIAVNSGTQSLSGLLITGNSAIIDYDFTAGYTGQRNFFVESALKTGLSSSIALGTQIVDLTLDVSSAGFTTGTAKFTGLSSLPSSFDMLKAVSNLTSAVGNGHLAAFANVDHITLTIKNRSTGLAPLIQFGSTTGVTAVPEPASLALLGITGVAGLFGIRRRRKVAA